MPKHKMKLTELENYTLWKVLDKVVENMSKDTEENEYRENSEDFILTLSVKEYKALKRCLNKTI